jgi:hypothetical protein
VEKIYNVLLDTKDDVKNPAFVVNTNDLKTVKINLLINQDGDPLDLTGATVRLAVKKPDKTTVLQDFTVVDALAGSCEIVLNTQAYVIDGKYDAEVMVYYGVDTVAVTGQFSYRAVKGILDDGTVESTNEWQSINQAIADAESIKTDAQASATSSAESAALAQNVINEAKGTYPSLSDRLVADETSLADSANKIKNQRVDVIVDYKAVGDDAADDGTKIQQAITDVFNAGGGTVFFPKPPVKYKYSQTLLVPENVFLEGIGEGTTGSRLHYTGTSWAMVTSSKHQRNSFKGLRFDLNGTGNGLRLGDVAANLGVNIPIQFHLENVTFENIASGFTALQTSNVSHISMKRVRIGFGSIVGGNALKITSDGFNSGVFKAEDCTFGRVDSTDIALEIDGSVNLDSYNFDSCYIGGQRVKIGVTTVVRSVNFEACHGEFRLLTGSALPNIDAFQLYKVYGGSWRGGTITCFGVAGSNAFRFKSDVKKFNIEGVEANGVMGAIYLQDGSTTVEGCILQEANLTNGATAVQYSGVSDQNFKLLAKRFQTENINVKTLFSVDGVNKDYWGSAPDVTQGHTRGDRVKNTLPSRTKNIGMWVTDTTGGAGAGGFNAIGIGYGTTAERPTLTVNDECYAYFDTTLGKMIVWNGTAWLT